MFWFDLFLEARAEILTKISLVLLVDLKTPKGDFEINWPLAWAEMEFTVHLLMAHKPVETSLANMTTGPKSLLSWHIYILWLEVLKKMKGGTFLQLVILLCNEVTMGWNRNYLSNFLMQFYTPFAWVPKTYDRNILKMLTKVFLKGTDLTKTIIMVNLPIPA